MEGNTNSAQVPESQNQTKDQQREAIDTSVFEQFCDPCQALVQKRIRSNKYQRLRIPQKCSKCQKMAIQYPNHKVCAKCSKECGVCGKCNKNKEVLGPSLLDEGKVLKERAALKNNLKTLRPKTRKSFHRCMDRQSCRSASNELMTEEDLCHDQTESIERVSTLEHEDYIRLALFLLNKLHAIKNNRDIEKQRHIHSHTPIRDRFEGFLLSCERMIHWIQTARGGNKSAYISKVEKLQKTVEQVNDLFLWIDETKDCIDGMALEREEDERNDDEEEEEKEEEEEEEEIDYWNYHMCFC